METSTLLLFAATVLPLVCTPGPDILFIAAQALAHGHASALRANAGVISGYVAHAVLGALGLAAVVAASPILFEVLRWSGVAYLGYLAFQMIRSAMSSGTLTLNSNSERASLIQGFLTSFLNPKGLLVYFTVLPSFITPSEGVAYQALALSAVFVSLCVIVYGMIGFVASALRHTGSINKTYRRVVEGFAGGMLAVAAARMANG